MTAIIALLGILLVLVLIVVSIYNSLIRKKNEVENAFGGMDAQLKKRYDLIPNLVETVKQYAKHEKGLFENITSLRAKAMGGQLSPNEKIEIDNQISQAIRGIMVSVENYPALKANENFLQLQGTMNEVESQISAARRTYNAVVTNFNNGIETFPSNIIAGMMNLQHKPVFDIPEEERKNVNVKELFKD